MTVAMRGCSKTDETRCELNASEKKQRSQNAVPAVNYKGTRPRGVTLLPRRVAARRGAPIDEDAEVGI